MTQRSSLSGAETKKQKMGCFAKAGLATGTESVFQFHPATDRIYVAALENM
jgi:hypothetical protein